MRRIYKSPPMWRRVLLALNALDRRVLRLPCEVCGDKRRCWRWHVEIIRCPVCLRDVDEFQPGFGPALDMAIAAKGRDPFRVWNPWVGASTVSASTYTLSFPNWGSVPRG